MHWGGGGAEFIYRMVGGAAGVVEGLVCSATVTGVGFAVGRVVVLRFLLREAEIKSRAVKWLVGLLSSLAFSLLLLFICEVAGVGVTEVNVVHSRCVTRCVAVLVVIVAPVVGCFWASGRKRSVGALMLGGLVLVGYWWLLLIMSHIFPLRKVHGAGAATGGGGGADSLSSIDSALRALVAVAAFVGVSIGGTLGGIGVVSLPFELLGTGRRAVSVEDVCCGFAQYFVALRQCADRKRAALPDPRGRSGAASHRRWSVYEMFSSWTGGGGAAGAAGAAGDGRRDSIDACGVLLPDAGALKEIEYMDVVARELFLDAHGISEDWSRFGVRLERGGPITWMRSALGSVLLVLCCFKMVNASLSLVRDPSTLSKGSAAGSIASLLSAVVGVPDDVSGWRLRDLVSLVLVVILFTFAVRGLLNNLRRAVVRASSLDAGDIVALTVAWTLGAFSLALLIGVQGNVPVKHRVVVRQSLDSGLNFEFLATWNHVAFTFAAVLSMVRLLLKSCTK